MEVRVPVSLSRHEIMCCAGLAVYIYIFLGAMVFVGMLSLLAYCYHQRRIARYLETDNMNNNMQRHSLIDR
ncbi:hypothetical protein DYB37_006914 [Aphanomyces astaci]|uniref:Uncharacterized protein n=2 Tax=Aphanomyces astaci TaxID=112090 RepID=A0A397BFB7_APHAT|nr:hypothetical protein DYB36_003080 [Aphanomyces astaci]RHY18192.1 hypothetical protein DYB25_005369 [Aphanomyces astaci]RHY89757.1 hypothetical protein DYB35_004720 [Aphanomyces astaci]RHZ25435.1 hypothetical protein DYB37_006914 [Aphanomyces astaci]